MTGADLVSRLGIFARTFRRDTPTEVADAVIGAGYALAHWNFAAIGRSTLAADVRDARTARRLLDEVGLDAPIGIILDPANLLTPETIDQQDKIIGEAIDLLGGRVIGLQAKDVVASGYSAPGAGLMDYPAVFAQLARLGPVPVIVQDACEDDAAQVRADLLHWYDEASVR
jgi:sugar phosphate isomerase/epimerase